jgi:hypothetical protein
MILIAFHLEPVHCTINGVLNKEGLGPFMGIVIAKKTAKEPIFVPVVSDHPDISAIHNASPRVAQATMVQILYRSIENFGTEHTRKRLTYAPISIEKKSHIVFPLMTVLIYKLLWKEIDHSLSFSVPTLG